MSDRGHRPMARLATGVARLLLLALVDTASAQVAVPVGKGSYADRVPEQEGADALKMMTTSNLFVINPTSRPIPSNQWWTDLIMRPYCGELWAHPLVVSADAQGVNVFFPGTWNTEGTRRELGEPLRLWGEVPPAQGDTTHMLIADFEGDALPSGWERTGDAFADVPARGAAPGQMEVKDFIGRGLVNSYRDGDQATGSLRSPAFFIRKPNIHLQVAGGNERDKLAVQLIVSDKVVRDATGEQNETLHWEHWDVRSLVGKSARIRILDDSSGGWGHILADQIFQSDAADTSEGFGDNRFRPADARARDWSDWSLTFRLAQAKRAAMDVTLGHGLPFIWTTFHGVIPLLSPPEGAEQFGLRGEALPAGPVTDQIGIAWSNACFGVYGPPGTRFTPDGDLLRVQLTGTNRTLAVAALPSRRALAAFRPYAGAVPRRTQMDWTYDPAAGTVTTRWELFTEPAWGGETRTIQGWLPHHVRGTTRDFTFTGLRYATPRGWMQCATGNVFTITWKFPGLAPALPAPRVTTTANPYDAARLRGYVTSYTNRTEYGGDTYWGGKHLLQYGQFLHLARVLDMPAEEAALRESLKRALTDWFTYTPGEAEHFFARYAQWGALVGFNASYGSEQFTDNHFHLGYFTAASALLGIADPSFLRDYGEMARLVAKQYANWERSDARFPFLRTFDVWEGHSWAGGGSSPGGNNQESSSEAMQAWGGLFMLGAALGDTGMRAAGAMGYAMEAEATREYWLDVHQTNLPAAYGHPATGILFGNGQAYATYFSGDPAWIHGIQWMPMSPLLGYLARDPAANRRAFAAMRRDRTAKEGSDDIGHMGTGLGNIMLAYAALFDPDWAAAQMDALWDANSGVVRENDTPGLSYHLIHVSRMLGERRWDCHVNPPTGAVYLNATTRVWSTVAFNATDAAATFTVHRPGKPAQSFPVPPRSLVVQPGAGD